MKVNPLNIDIFSKRIDDSFNIFYIFGNNLGLIDICYSKLKENLEIDLDNPFKTNYFDENRLLNNTESFFDELNSISLFGEKKTVIVDIRQSDKKNDVTKLFNDFNFSEIKNTQLIIVSYSFKQNDSFSKKIINNKNVMFFTCYEEEEYNIKSNLKNELKKVKINLNEAQIHELTTKFSKDSKIIQNTFEKIRLQNNTNDIDFDQLLLIIDNNSDKTVFEMINKLMIRNYHEAMNLLANFEYKNTSSISILNAIKSKFKLLKKCINMKEDGFSKNEIVNNKALNIFYKEHSIILKMIDLWNLKKIDACLFFLFKTELNCKAKKDHEYIFLNQLFLFIYFKSKV